MIATAQDAGYAPHHHLNVRADWRFASGWMFSGHANHVAGRKRSAGDIRPDIADYTSVHLTLRTSRSKRGWEFAASVRSLFDADVRESSPSPLGKISPCINKCRAT